MNVLVMYYSRSGNTARLAEAIAQGVHQEEGIDCVLKAVADVTQEDFAACDGIIAGSPVYFGGMASELKEAFDQFVSIRSQMEGKVGAAFATAGDPSGGKETTIMSILQALLIYGMVVVGDPMSATGHYGVSCVDAPDERTIDNAAKLGLRVASLVKQLRA